ENEDLSNLHTRLQGLADAGLSCPTDEDSSDSFDSEVEITPTKTFEEFAALVQIARKTMTFTDDTSYGRFAAIQKLQCLALFDEATAMHRTDGLMVFGNTMRPVFAVGNEKQLPPALLTLGETYSDGTAIKRFGQDAKPSWLS
ncbi:DNA helicase, partial [Fusarium napiforme]